MHVLYWIVAIVAYLVIGKLIATISEWAWENGMEWENETWTIRESAPALCYINFPLSLLLDKVFGPENHACVPIEEESFGRKKYRILVTLFWPIKIAWNLTIGPICGLVYFITIFSLKTPWAKKTVPNPPELLPAESILKEIATLETDRARIDERIGVLRSQLGTPYRLETRETDAPDANASESSTDSKARRAS